MLGILSISLFFFLVAGCSPGVEGSAVLSEEKPGPRGTDDVLVPEGDFLAYVRQRARARAKSSSEHMLDCRAIFRPSGISFDIHYRIYVFGEASYFAAARGPESDSIFWSANQLGRGADGFWRAQTPNSVIRWQYESGSNKVIFYHGNQSTVASTSSCSSREVSTITSCKRTSTRTRAVLIAPLFNRCSDMDNDEAGLLNQGETYLDDCRQTGTNFIGLLECTCSSFRMGPKCPTYPQWNHDQ